jgi:hypothetical protein
LVLPSCLERDACVAIVVTRRTRVRENNVAGNVPAPPAPLKWRATKTRSTKNALRRHHPTQGGQEWSDFARNMATISVSDQLGGD